MRYLIILLFLSFPSYSFNLDDAFDKLQEKQEGKGVSINNLADSLKTEAKDIENKINDKIASYDKKLKDEIHKVTTDIDNKIKEANEIKEKAHSMLEKAETILKWSKIFIAIITSSVVAILLLIYRAFMKIKAITGVIENVTNYKDIVERIEKLEGAK